MSEIQLLVEYCTNFYTQLFAKGDIYSISQKKLLSFLTSKLIDDQIALIEGDITETEVIAMIQDTLLNSLPSIDSLSFEFYQYFYNILILFLFKIYNSLFLQNIV